MPLFPRERNDELRELALLRFHADFSSVLLHYDVVAHRQPEPGAGTRRLRGEKRFEDLFADMFRNAIAVVAKPDFNRVSEIDGGHPQSRTEAVFHALGFLIRSIAGIVRDIQNNA